MIFGPFYSYNQRIVANELKGTKTFIINPFSKEMNLVKGNPNMFKIEPEYTTQVYQMCKWVSDSMHDANILIIQNGKDDELNNVNELKKNFGLNGIKADQIKVFSYKDGGLAKMTAALRKDKQNILINVVNNEATITSFVRQINNLVKDYDITVLGSENRWENFTMLEKEYLSNLKLLQFSSSFVNYDRPDVQQFVLQFATKYLTDPKEIAFQGFDQAYYFLSLLQKYGENFPNCMDKEEINTMYTKFDFKKNGNDAWQNTFENIYQYDNFKLVDKIRILPVVVEPIKE
jgi:ABC-type branched-subunit amino acid transport system substrate-binding protein